MENRLRHVVVLFKQSTNSVTYILLWLFHNLCRKPLFVLTLALYMTIALKLVIKILVSYVHVIVSAQTSKGGGGALLFKMVVLKKYFVLFVYKTRPTGSSWSIGLNPEDRINRKLKYQILHHMSE